MLEPAPPIDERTAEDFCSQVRSHLAETSLVAPDTAADALIQIFARYGEIIVDRLNRVPEKNLYAFLNLLGISPVPAVPARVPLTFSAVAGASFAVRVPARTNIAATARDDETEPVVFETEQELEVTPAQLVRVLYFDPANDMEADLSYAANQQAEMDNLFAAQHRSDHALFLGQSKIFGMAQGTRLHLLVDSDCESRGVSAAPVMEWAIFAGEKAVPIQPISDTTGNFSKSGEIVFDGVPKWPVATFRGVASRWLVARLAAPLGNDSAAKASIRNLRASAEIRLRSIPVEAAFSGSQAIDLSKDFLPFSARPAFGSILYLKSEAFSPAGAHVTVNIQLTNPYGDAEKTAVSEVFADGHPRLWWETWRGDQWVRLTETDSTKGLRIDGAVGFVLPESVAIVPVNGVAGYWIRVRLMSGNYGEEEHWDTSSLVPAAGGPKLVRATLSPPMIQKVTLDYELTAPPEPFDCAIGLNQQVYEDVSAAVNSGEAVRPFRRVFDEPTVLLGFDYTQSLFFRNRVLTCFLVLAEEPGRPNSRDNQRARNETRWSYTGDAGWEALPVDDETLGWTRSGTISFVVPDDITAQDYIGDMGSRFWFRVSAGDRTDSLLTRVCGVLPNTVMAVHARQIEKEILGSSDATPLQSFFSSHSPILRDLDVQIREGSAPSETEQLIRLLPAADLEIVEDPPGTPREGWVRWKETEDLELSRSDDRHFRVDRDTGEISLGDGRHGRIPCRGSNNVRLRRYRVGGGARGNQPIGTVTQLRSAIPYVQAVTNHVEAKGGYDAETAPHAVERGAKIARHRGRAITVDDFEDLAPLASAEVARARCIPMRDLVKDPDGRQFFPGTISLIVLSSVSGENPAGGTELLDRVREFLDQRRDLSTDLVVTSPESVTVSVEVEFIPESPHLISLAQASLKTALTEYLDPVNGGSSGEGWEFGQLPGRQEIYGLCASTPGVQAMWSLRVKTSEERAGAISAGYFALRSGQHKITPVAASVSEATTGRGSL